MAQKIYTKTGDDGTTSLLGGRKVSKSDTRIEAYGTVDELNSFIGLLIDYAADTSSVTVLRNVQERLFTIGSELACDPETPPKLWVPDLKNEDIELLENAIDKMEEELPAMKHFVLPGGHPAVSTAHICRTICRRAERNCARIATGSQTDRLILKYVNRLSDYFFVLSRFYAQVLGISERQWIPRQ